jgi:hypothetical protein
MSLSGQSRGSLRSFTVFKHGLIFGQLKPYSPYLTGNTANNCVLAQPERSAILAIMITTAAAQRIAIYLTALPGERIKAAMQAWSAETDTNIEDLAESLARESAVQEQAAIAAADAAAEDPAFTMKFPSMTEEEMVKASREAYADHLSNGGKGYTQSEVENWVATLQASAQWPN